MARQTWAVHHPNSRNRTQVIRRLKLSCSNCGARLGAAQVFCSTCGGRIEKSQTEEQ